MSAAQKQSSPLTSTRMIVLIGGTSYAGEMKKSVFTALTISYQKQALCPCIVLPMLATIMTAPYSSAFQVQVKQRFPQTLHARSLVMMNMAGAKMVSSILKVDVMQTIRLSEEAEPEIYATTQRFGTVLENVVLDENRVPDFDDGSLTENTRCAPIRLNLSQMQARLALHHTRKTLSCSQQMLSCIAPHCKINACTSDVSLPIGLYRKSRWHRKGCDRARSHSQPVFGAPLCRVTHQNMAISCVNSLPNMMWLLFVNTGWTGGAYGVGERMPIRVTRALLASALDGSLNDVTFRKGPAFWLRCARICVQYP